MTATHYRRHLSLVTTGAAPVTPTAVTLNGIVGPTNLPAASIPSNVPASVKVTCAGPNVCPPLNFFGSDPGATVAVYAQSGQPVAAVTADANGRAAWPETDAAGNPVPAGIYFVSVRKVGKARWTQVTLLR